MLTYHLISSTARWRLLYFNRYEYKVHIWSVRQIVVSNIAFSGMKQAPSAAVRTCLSKSTECNKLELIKCFLCPIDHY